MVDTRQPDFRKQYKISHTAFLVALAQGLAYTQGHTKDQRAGKGEGNSDKGKGSIQKGQKAASHTCDSRFRMLSLFQRNSTCLITGADQAPPIDMPKGLIRPESATTLLATPRRQKLLEHIWQRTSLSRRQFKTLYLIPLEHYAELVQLFPASEAHHHAYPGGMLDHGLEVVAYALKLRQSHLLPAGMKPEEQAAQAEAWTAGTAYAALLHDIGKLVVDIHVEYADGSVWHPWHGPLQRLYRFRYRKEREYRLHSAATGLLCTQLLNRGILDWLCQYPDLWTALLYVLAGQYEHAGTLGDLVGRADQASVAQELGGDPSKAITAPKHALQRKLIDGLRYLLKEELKLNQPQASDGWLTQDALWLVSKTVSDKLRAHLLSQGIDGIPSNNTAVFNVLQDHGLLQPTPDGKAIWRATINSEAGWSHSFTLLRMWPALIWPPDERPEPFVGTVTIETPSGGSTTEQLTTRADEVADSIMTNAGNAVDAAERPLSKPASTSDSARCQSTEEPTAEAVSDLLSLLREPPTQETSEGRVQPVRNSSSESIPSAKLPTDGTVSSPKNVPKPPDCSAPSGEHFITWLCESIHARRLIINDAKALVHTVADTVFLVSPGIFQRYTQEHPDISDLARQEKVQDWQWVQKRFEKLQLHRKQASGLNIWICDVMGPRKSRRLHGYLLTTWRTIINDLPPNNPYLSLRNTEDGSRY